MPLKKGSRKKPAKLNRCPDEEQREHKKLFLPVLQTLVQSVREKKRCQEFDVPSKHLTFLNDVGFFKVFLSSYSTVNVYQDLVLQKLYIKGRGDDFNHAYDSCCCVLQEIFEQSLALSSKEDTRLWDLIAQVHAQKCVNDILTSRNIQAKISASDRDYKIVIIAINRVAYRKAREILLNLITQEIYSVPEDVDVPSENENIQKFLKKQELRLTLKVNFQPTSKEIDMVGFEEDVKQAISETSQFLEPLRRKSTSFTKNLRPDISKFIEIYFYKMKEVKEASQNLNVSVNLEIQSPVVLQFTITGLVENISSCRCILNKMISGIVSEDKNVSYPGLKKLFDAKEGRDNLAAIERKWMVHIVTISQEPQIVIPKSGKFLNSSTQSTHDRYNYTTNEGVKFFCKVGRIENETASVLVNSAHSNLNNPTACSKALEKQGGAPYLAGCKVHTNIPLWDIACTPGGNLSCQHVIHAVCGSWNDNNKQKCEKALRDLITKILLKCIELRVSSVAMPTIGAGKHCYPEDIVLNIIKEEVERISSIHGTQNSLKSVSVIVFKEEKSSDKMNKSSDVTSTAPQLKTVEQSTNEYHDHVGKIDEIELHFVGSKNDIDNAISEVNSFIESNKMETTIEDVGDILLKHWSEVDSLSNALSIKCRVTGGLTVQGMKDDVNEFLLKFAELQKNYQLDEQRKMWIREMSHYVQWYYLLAGNWEQYDCSMNGIIESAYQRGLQEFDIVIDDETYHIKFSCMGMQSSKTDLWFEIARGNAGDPLDGLPALWDAQPAGKKVHLVTLLSSSQEYTDVLTDFRNNFKSGSPPTVTKIQRIQNPSLYGPYLAKKKSMKDNHNEARLFHGTQAKNISAINENNFNRSFAGINGTLYGKGVYFTNNSSYALGFCVSHNGFLADTSTNADVESFQMYAVKVLLGEFTKGCRSMITAPSKNDLKNPNLLYDSVVNNIAKPEIFVVFIDHQCYPEYLINFNCTTGRKVR